MSGHYLADELTLDEAVQRTKFRTHRLVRRQYSWFKLNDPRINWLEAAGVDLQKQAYDLVDRFLASTYSCDTLKGHPSGSPSDEIH